MASVISAPRPDGLDTHRIRGRRQPSFGLLRRQTVAAGETRTAQHAHALNPENPETRVDLLGRFSNHDIAARIDRLANRLSRQALLHPAREPNPPSIPVMRRLRRKPGEVQAAAREVLAATNGSLRLCELHAALVEELDENVSRSSVKMALRRGLEGSPPLFDQPSRGRYRLS
jgi:hypothetical protein